MSLSKICAAALMAVGLSLSAVAPARAALVSWDVDSSVSYMRLTLPDQSIPVEGIGNVTIRLRDASSTSQWTDAGGRRAFLDGTISTNLNDGTSVQFNGGAHNLFALENANLRPNPAAFNPGATNGDNPDGTYTNTTTAPAAFGAKVRGTFLLSFDAAFLAFRDAFFDIASGVVPLDGGGAYAGSTTNVGIASALIDADGLSLPLGLGQPIPDILGAAISLPNLVNTSGGVITNLGGNDRQLDMTITVPISIDVEGILITGSATGVIRAYTTLIPEPSTIAMAGIAALGLCVAGRRRFRRS